MEDFFDGLIFLDALIVSKESRVGCFQKFVKGERIQVEQIDHAHGIGLWLREAGCQADFRLAATWYSFAFSLKYLRAFSASGPFLHLVKNDESLSGQNLFPGDHGKQFQ